MTATVQVDSIIREASAFVYKLFKDSLPPAITYHSYSHTADVASEADKIGRNSDLSRRDLQLVTLAAWFHDTGFTRTFENHEEASIQIAREFLANRGMPEKDIDQVAAYINATRSAYVPKTMGEMVIHDADRSHVGKKKFLKVGERLRKEWENLQNRVFTDQEWAESQLEFLTSVQFYTDYARENYRQRWQQNLREQQKLLARMLESKSDMPQDVDTRTVSSRGIQTMFRSTYRNHINLSSIADSKANIMISVNAILMSIIISFVSSRLAASPWLLAPSGVLLITSLAATVFAILSARPKVTSKVFTIEDVRRDRANILFFGNFVNMSLDDFTIGVNELMGDENMLYNNMIADIHSLGQVLSQKYRLLWLSYTVFMAGLSLSVLLFIFLFIFVA